MLLTVIEHDRGEMPEAAREAMTAARSSGERWEQPVHAVVVGNGADGLTDELAGLGAEVVHVVSHDLLTDYGPEAWGEALRQLVVELEPAAVMTVGSDRGNEVMAQLAARLDLPFAANCVRCDPPGEDGRVALTRVQWGGSLLEDATLTTPLPLLSFGLHVVAAEPVAERGAGLVEIFRPELDATVASTIVVDRVVLTHGITLPTASVVVGGGRGVGSAPGFAPLEELAELMGGVVGCSRAVTNNGWRPHADQVGQTGTRIAPDLYIASGISGAIQHWVGAMASKKILAINTDPEANMVIRADYAVIADLHVVVPAITAEIRRRRAEKS